jgi:hypothetical protein
MCCQSWSWYFLFVMAHSYIVAEPNMVKCIYIVLALRVWCYAFAVATYAWACMVREDGGSHNSLLCTFTIHTFTYSQISVSQEASTSYPHPQHMLKSCMCSFLPRSKCFIIAFTTQSQENFAPSKFFQQFQVFRQLLVLQLWMWTIS